MNTYSKTLVSIFFLNIHNSFFSLIRNVSGIQKKNYLRKSKFLVFFLLQNKFNIFASNLTTFLMARKNVSTPLFSGNVEGKNISKI